jgi:tyrosyl-tRNA synthetase
LVSSNAEARRLLQQGAVTLNGEKITDPDFEFVPTEESVLRVGKRRFLKITVQ